MRCDRQTDTTSTNDEPQDNHITCLCQLFRKQKQDDCQRNYNHPNQTPYPRVERWYQAKSIGNNNSTPFANKCKPQWHNKYRNK